MTPPKDPVSAASEVLDLREVPPMELVSSIEGCDNLESDDDESVTTGASEESEVTTMTSKASSRVDDAPFPRPAAPQQPTPDVPRSTRRTRGMSFLPVRQSTRGAAVNLTSPTASSSPPTTPSPLRPLTYSHGSDSQRRSSDSNGHNAQARSQPGTPTVSTDTSETLLVAYMNQLAAKEARVVDLRNTIGRLQKELKEAEIDLSAYKDNGKTLAELINLPEGGKLAALKAGVPGGLGESQKDVLGMGRRVVDEIGTQFWSFLEDVKSATMGTNEFPTNAHGGPAIQIPESIPRSPSPHRQISPKRSIQDFLKNRPRSPIRRSRSPANSHERQRVAEHHASQRLRESERLTKKLSHIDLRAPSPTRVQHDSYQEAPEP